MQIKIKQLTSRIIRKIRYHADLGYIKNQAVIGKFTDDPDNTFLISYPRTGSHWLRIIMELYFERPSLNRVFYYHKCKDYLTLHSHDFDLDVERSKVIYLYRNPTDTIYSLLNYYKEPWDSRDRIIHLSDSYGRHLDKWLHSERFTKQKTILTYEGMKQDIAAEFTKVTEHFGQELDKTRLEKVIAQITREEVKRKTKFDSKVVQLRPEYDISRDKFQKMYKTLVWNNLTKERPHLLKYFPAEDPVSK
jgi:hypothetical protein